MPNRLALWGLVAVFAGCGPDPVFSDPGLLQQRTSALAWGEGHQNGAFLSHAYVTTQSYVNATQTMLGKMKAYEVKNLYVNIGQLGTAGTITDSYSLAASYLAQVAAYEQSSGYTFRVFAWMNGSFEGTTALDLDPTTGATVRANITAECERFLSSTISGSHLPGATRTFDGCEFDLEPSGPYASSTDDTHFNNWKSLMQSTRTDLNAKGLGAKSIAVAAPQYGDGSKWKWPLRYFYYMARYVNQITLMSYDSSSATSTDYQAWIQAQVHDSLRAISGVGYGDGSHPPPTNGVVLLVGFPAYPDNSPVHVATAEFITPAANGTNAALDALSADTTDSSESFFGGGTMYLTTDGSDSSTYARYNYEWYWWEKFWLGMNLP